jgi:4-amino-4-deoxy-L-arabinose transferase-like glycosyltransferase
MSEQQDTEREEVPVPCLSWRWDGFIALGLALASLLVVAAGLNHYGLTYDEGWYISKSILARRWAARLVTRPGEALSERGIQRYWYATRELESGEVMAEQQPGAAKLVNGLLGYPIGLAFGAAWPDRAGTAILLAGCLACLYLFMAALWGRTAGLFAALALLSMPRVFAHAHLATMDVPVMASTFACVAVMFYAVVRRKVTWAVVGGLLWGVALSCKINALFVPLVLAAWILIFHRSFAWQAAACLAAGGTVGFFVTWPWLWREPWTHLTEYLAFHLQHYPVAVSYFGHVSPHQPWHYPIVMTAITTPPLILLLAVGGLAVVVRSLARRGATLDTPDGWKRSQLALIVIGAVLNIGFNSLPSAPKYGGVRLFLPFFPYLVALAAVGLGTAATWVVSRVGTSSVTFTPRRLRIALAAVALLPGLCAVGNTYPYQLSYYNPFIGGLRGAVARGMEATYWGESYLEAANFLLPRLSPNDLVWVDLPGCEWIIRRYLENAQPGLRFSSGGWPPEEADWAIVQNKASELSPASRALMAAAVPRSIGDLGGVPLSLVYDNQGIRRARELMPESERGS